MKRLGFLMSLLLPLIVRAQNMPEAKPQATPPTEVYATADDGTPLTWDVYTPTGRGPWPAVLVIHGGRFVFGGPDDAGVRQCATDLSQAGFIAFAITYRLAPPGSIPGQRSSGRCPDQYNDVGLAVEAARSDPRGTGMVGSVGGSAGGTHTAWVAATGNGQSQLDVGVCLSGVYDFADFTPDPDLQELIDTVTNYVGVPATDLPALRAASPAWALDRNVAPLYLFQSQNDEIPAAQFSDMITRLMMVGARNYKSETLPGNLHSFAYWTQVKGEAIDFLAGVLKPRTR